MISQRFSKLLNDPGALNNESLAFLEDLEKRYPYCQSVQLLLACNFYVQEDHHYPSQLKKAAAYAGDRRMLRELIGREKELRSFPLDSATIEIPPPDSCLPEPASALPEPASPLPEPPSLMYERLTQEELLAIVKKRLAEIDAENKHEAEFSGLPEPESNIPGPGPIVTKASLIEKFIREEPRISKPKTAFFNPADSAFRSNFDEEEIVSETLAQLYAQQGNIQKAVHIYEKLSLINQEKCRYFAAQIEKLTS